MRVRDVEIALVLAREMKAAAARDVDASLRLEQLQEVFGAEGLDRGERARIQTALQMAGLEPRPSLLEAEPAEPIRFALSGDAAPVAAPAEEQAAAEGQELPTVGEFAKSAFRRFRGRRGAADGGDVTTAEEPAPGGGDLGGEPVAPEPYAEEPEAEAPEELDEPPVEEPGPGTNGAVNGHSHLYFDVDGILDDVVLPEPEPEHEEQPEPEPEPALAQPQPASLLAPVAEPQPTAAPRPQVAALLLPAAAIPVLVASVAGWSFGLPFLAFALIATGVLASRGGGSLAALRSVPGTRAALTATAIVTVAALAVSLVLRGADTGGGGTTATKPAAQKPRTRQPPASRAPAATTPSKSPARSAKPSRSRKHRRRAKTQSPTSDKSTQGLIRVPASSGRTSTTPSGTSTTPSAPSGTGTTPSGTKTTP